MNSSTLTTTSFESQNVTLYPNPFKDNIYFDLPESYNNATINIYDIKGKLIYTGHVKNNTVNLNTLSNGIYLVKLISKNNKKVTVKKLIKQ